MASTTANGITIGFEDRGTGRDTLLLIHGHPFNRSMWSPQLSAVADAGWRVIAPDLRGYGESTVAPGITLLETFAADLAALLDTLGINSVVVGGLSMGGQIAMEFARQFPQRVRGLLLAATFPQSETDEGKVRRKAMAERLVRDGMEEYAAEVLPKMLAPRSIEALPAVANHVLTMMRTSDRYGAAAAVVGRGERPSYEGTLASLVVPALVVVGTEDAFTSREDALLMHTLLNGSELLWLEGIGHMPNLEDPALFNAGLLRLLERVAPTQRIGSFR
jgi:pimeloyl-ACP methyl ester carboxylesterase